MVRNIDELEQSMPPSLKSLGVLLSLSDWKTLTRRLELIDADLTERDATLCFVNSRMAVIDGTSDRGKLKELSKNQQMIEVNHSNYFRI